jgi:hypothetical protein
VTSSTDRILGILDAGLQTPVPDPTYGEVSDKVHGRCARCESHDPAEGGDLCEGCRAFLLGDSETDPAVGDSVERQERWARDWVELAEFAGRVREVFGARLEVLADVTATCQVCGSPVTDIEHTPSDPRTT